MTSRRSSGWVLSVLMSITIGSALGIGGFTFVYARGASYLSNDPAACANCHIMSEQFDGWIRSSHRNVAMCNDCHTPGNPVGKYLTKGMNGFRHSFAFTTGWFPEPIKITQTNRAIAEASCRRCHGDIVMNMDSVHRSGDEVSCIRCHGSVGHPTR